MSGMVTRQAGDGALMRLAMLLLALAGLADRAAVASGAARSSALPFLQWAGAIAPAVLMLRARDLGLPLPPQAWLAMRTPAIADKNGCSSDDGAAALAGRFRLLACALLQLAVCEALQGRLAAAGPRRPSPVPQEGRHAAFLRHVPRVRAPDTS